MEATRVHRSRNYGKAPRSGLVADAAVFPTQNPIEHTLSGQSQQPPPPAPPAQTNNLGPIISYEQFISTDAVYKALSSLCTFAGAERKKILDSLSKQCFESYGSGFKDPDTLFNYIYEVEDGTLLRDIKIRQTDVAPRRQQPQQLHQTARHHDEMDGPYQMDGPPQPSTRGDVVSDHVQQQRQANSQRTATPKDQRKGQQGVWKKSEFTCKVCLDQLISVTFVPCGHLVACVSCASALLECPVCRASIRGTIKTFF